MRRAVPRPSGFLRSVGRELAGEQLLLHRALEHQAREDRRDPDDHPGLRRAGVIEATNATLSCGINRRERRVLGQKLLGAQPGRRGAGRPGWRCQGTALQLLYCGGTCASTPETFEAKVFTWIVPEDGEADRAPEVPHELGERGRDAYLLPRRRVLYRKEAWRESHPDPEPGERHGLHDLDRPTVALKKVRV